MDDLTNLLDTTGQYKSTYERSVIAIKKAIAQSALLKPQQAGDPPTLLCEGSIRIGWVDAATLRPQRIPAAVLQVLQAGRATPAPTT